MPPVGRGSFRRCQEKERGGKRREGEPRGALGALGTRGTSDTAKLYQPTWERDCACRLAEACPELLSLRTRASLPLNARELKG
uniref:Uncharacterized protein n=1 Tax=Rangifer tarandus platyrhynchus TaxID=3082113 RepID=A0ACB0FJF8_RANTA|nr:unnamed protein product [Rangifer tarandus platyrhynchus]